MSDINVEQITTGTTEGTGVFDKLMQSVTSHIEEQYKTGRLTGTDYANVYLGSIQAAMQQSVTFLLGEQQAEQQAALLQAQTEEVGSRISLLEAQIAEQLAGTGRANTELSDRLVSTAKERDSVDQNMKLVDVQIGEQIAATSRADTQLSDALETSRQQREQLQSQIELGTIQIQQVAAAISRDDVQSNKDLEVKDAGIAKATSEKGLLDKKALTETQQTTLVQKQQNLYTAQTEGFARDAEQKAAQLLTEIWTVAKGSDTDAYTIPVSNADIGKYIEDAVQNAGLVKTNP